MSYSAEEQRVVSSGEGVVLRHLCFVELTDSADYIRLVADTGWTRLVLPAPPLRKGNGSNTTCRHSALAFAH